MGSRTFWWLFLNIFWHFIYEIWNRFIKKSKMQIVWWFPSVSSRLLCSVFWWSSRPPPLPAGDSPPGLSKEIASALSHVPGFEMDPFSLDDPLRMDPLALDMLEGDLMLADPAVEDSFRSDRLKWPRTSSAPGARWDSAKRRPPGRRWNGPGPAPLRRPLTTPPTRRSAERGLEATRESPGGLVLVMKDLRVLSAVGTWLKEGEFSVEGT